MLAVGLVVLGGMSGVARGSAATRAANLPAQFTVIGEQRLIPPSFFGVSVEYNELGTYEREGRLFDRVLSLIRPPDAGPLMLRVGGRSADHVYWQATHAARPQYVSLIGSRWLQRLGALVTRDHLRVMLDLNLAVHAPALEADFAVAARRALPAGSLAGLEVGNEPDLYAGQSQLAQQRIPGTDVAADWTRRYSAGDYRRDFRSYAHALVARVPGIALAGPETLFSPDPAWLAAVQDLGRLTPRILTVHRYVSSDCAPAGSTSHPTLATLLSPDAAAGLGASAAGPVAFARAHGESLRVSEVNSISCGGTPGVSDSFASALWAPDLLFSFLRAGVSAVNWETRPGTVNTPFHADAHSISARPSLYGLAAFAEMTGPGSQLERSRLTAAAGLHLTGWAVRVHGGVRVLLINKGTRAATVTVDTGITGRAFVRRLTAPGIGARTGVTFAGRSINADGRWHGRLIAPAIPDRNGRSQLTVPGDSAALLSVER